MDTFYLWFYRSLHARVKFHTCVLRNSWVNLAEIEQCYSHWLGSTISVALRIKPSSSLYLLADQWSVIRTEEWSNFTHHNSPTKSSLFRATSAKINEPPEFSSQNQPHLCWHKPNCASSDAKLSNLLSGTSLHTPSVGEDTKNRAHFKLPTKQTEQID